MKPDQVNSTSEDPNGENVIVSLFFSKSMYFVNNVIISQSISFYSLIIIIFFFTEKKQGMKYIYEKKCRAL